ncbi:MAG: hypothetical protein JXA28_12885 [Bacteroidetes bacterium]|nr:hypothetical protein [Bacteroidota bacterium]
MLHAFLDGELDGSHEELLFHKLSDSSALRAEMQQQLAIRTSIQRDTEAFTPPAVATSAIFAALGFSLPPLATMQAATHASSGGMAGGFAAGSSGMRRLLFSIGSGMLAIIAAVLLYMQFPFGQSTDSAISERVISGPPTTIEIHEIPALGDLPVAAAAPVHTANPRALTEEAVPVQISFHKRNTAVRPHPVEALAANGVRIDPSEVRAGQIQFFDLIPAPDGITLYARNAALRSDPSPAVVSQSDPWFRNMNLGLMYTLSDYHAIGIEVGQESFPQTFRGIEGGEDVWYEQNPLAYWATAVYQFNGDALLPHVHPFAQAQFGGAARLGPLARATVGLKFRPFERIAILAGLEGSMLLYRFQDTWFHTDKIGLTWGVAYAF